MFKMKSILLRNHITNLIPPEIKVNIVQSEL